jgi:transcriptional regulator with XRE-family HTH domain
MAPRERPRDRGTRLAARSLAVLGEELRRARIASGLSQKAVADAAGIAHTTVGRIERHRLAGVSIDVLSRACAVVGMDLVIRAYPAGDPLRDAAQVTLLERLRRRLPGAIRWRDEVPLPISGDLRAWDAVIGPSNAETAIEAETRLHDLQAMERRINRKQRDGSMDRVIVLIAETRANRAALDLGRESLRGAFPLDTREVLTALGSGRQPIANGIVVL